MPFWFCCVPAHVFFPSARKMKPFLVAAVLASWASMAMAGCYTEPGFTEITRKLQYAYLVIILHRTKCFWSPCQPRCREPGFTEITRKLQYEYVVTILHRTKFFWSACQPRCREPGFTEITRKLKYEYLLIILHRTKCFDPNVILGIGNLVLQKTHIRYYTSK